MMLATTCYPRDVLQRYLHGQADDELSGAIELHLQACSRCEGTLSELDTGANLKTEGDSLVRTLQRKPENVPTESPKWVADVAGRSYQLHDEPAAQREETLPPSELGDYELCDVIGRGGMSIVFSARHKHLGRDVALKVLLPTAQQHTVSRDRFVREMRAIGGLDHPSIIRATDAGECSDTLYLVMDRIDGVDLNHVSRCEGPLPVADACAIGIEVAYGLAHAHQQGVVHRDIKPSNVMLDRRGNVKILDFGLARIQSAPRDVSLQTTIGQLLGTLDYMAPEQASGSEVDARADIYALGATLFRLLSGVPPHGRSAELPIIEFLNRLANEKARRLDEFRNELPIELVELISGMLEQDPQKRVADAGEVAERLQPFAGGAQLSDLACRAIANRSVTAGRNDDSIQQTLSQLWPKSISGDEPPEEASPGVAVQPSFGVVAWSALATGLIGLTSVVLLTIFLTLKSPEGEIRFESDVLDNVKVEVVDEEDRVSFIAVDQGGSTTTLRTGRYRIRLDSSSDGLEITPSEVTVTKGNVAIAKLTRITPNQGPQPIDEKRDPVVAMEAQVELEKVTAELADAKQQREPDASAIKDLEEKQLRLRALSRAIPTEPVYEGRTLADWVAQMKFERESDAQSRAIHSVLKLVGTRPDEERMQLVLDAGSRLLARNRQPIDSQLLDILVWMRSEDDLGTTTNMIIELDRDIATSHLERALNSDEDRFRDYALVTCAKLRNQIRLGQWPELLAALQARSESDSGVMKTCSRLTLAACTPDAQRARELLVDIDTAAATPSTIIAMMHVDNERTLNVAQEQQVEWTAAYVNQIVDPNQLSALLDDPQVGPFRKADWDEMDEGIQAIVNSMVVPLLDSFEQQLTAAESDLLDAKRNQSVGVKSRVLLRVIDRSNLTGDAGERAIGLLERRLMQLLRVRKQATEIPADDLDTPARLATGLMLLTGSVPEPVRQTHFDQSGPLADHLAAIRKVFATQSMTGNIQPLIASALRKHSLSLVGEWYPYELMHIVAEARAPTSRPSDYFQFLRSRSDLPFDSRLLVDFARISAEAAQFTSQFLVDESLRSHMRRHPAFRQSVTEMMESSDNVYAAELAFNLWREGHSIEETHEQIESWLKSGPPVQTRIAIASVVVRSGRTRKLQIGEGWSAKVSTAIDRLANAVPLNDQEMTILELLGDGAPHASDHAIKYLTEALENYDPDIGAIPGLQAAAKIILSDPEKREEFEPTLERLLNEAPNITFDDRSVLQIIQKANEGAE